MLFLFIYMSLPLQFFQCTSSSDYLKLLLDVFHIHYTNSEATLPDWIAKYCLTPSSLEIWRHIKSTMNLV